MENRVKETRLLQPPGESFGSTQRSVPCSGTADKALIRPCLRYPLARLRVSPLMFAWYPRPTRFNLFPVATSPNLAGKHAAVSNVAARHLPCQPKTVTRTRKADRKSTRLNSSHA